MLIYASSIAIGNQELGDVPCWMKDMADEEGRPRRGRYGSRRECDELNLYISL